MKTAEEIAQEWWDAKISGHPKPIAEFIIQEVIREVLAQLRPEIEKLIAEQFAVTEEGAWGKVEKRPIPVIEGPPSDLYDANPGGER